MKKNQLKFLRSKNFRSKNFKIELSLIILLIVGSVTFSPILKNSFINWDDPAQLLENPLVRGFSARNLGKIFTTSVVSEYHPLVTAIFFFEYHLFGPNPYPYHLHSLILHLINGWLVFFLFYRLSDKIPVALAGSLLFLVHPFQVQAVAWISARKDLLFICFYLASFLSYYFFQSDKKKSLYLLSLLFFICALLSKALAITLPVILLLWIYSEKKRITSRELKGILPFIFLALTTGWFALRMQVVREPGSAAHLDFSFENVILMFGNCKFYLHLSEEHQFLGTALLLFFLPHFLSADWIMVVSRQQIPCPGRGFFYYHIIPGIEIYPFCRGRGGGAQIYLSFWRGTFLYRGMDILSAYAAGAEKNKEIWYYYSLDGNYPFPGYLKRAPLPSLER